MTRRIQLQGTIGKIETLSDGTVRLRVDTQEVSPEDATTLFEQRGELGWFVFSANKMKSISIPDEPPKEFADDRTPSKRLRAALYVAWGQSNASTRGDFDSFYKRNMERIIEHVKAQLT